MACLGDMWGSMMLVVDSATEACYWKRGPVGLSWLWEERVRKEDGCERAVNTVTKDPLTYDDCTTRQQKVRNEEQEDVWSDVLSVLNESDTDTPKRGCMTKQQ